MKVQKNDYRSRYTQVTIKQALLQLLTTKPLNRIYVSELCEIAHINRGTFYNHFYDIYDVYETIENSFFADIKLKLNHVSLSDASFFSDIMHYIADNAILSNLILINQNNSDFLKKTINYAKDKFISQWKEEYKDVSPLLLEQIFNYNTNGSIGLIFDWVNNKMSQPIDEIAQLITDFNNAVYKKVLG